MPTQEERLTALEQSQIKFGEAISDLNHYVTMVLGVVQKQEWEMREMRGSLRTLDSNVQIIERNVQTLQQNVQNLQQNVQALQQNIQTIDNTVQTLEHNMSARFEEQDKKLDSILHILNTLTGRSD